MSEDYTLKARKNMRDLVDLHNEERVLNDDFKINEIFKRDQEKRETFEVEVKQSIIDEQIK